MANLSAIKLPNGTTYNLKDSVSGYTTNTGTITKVQTTAGAHTTINVTSGAATFNVPTTAAHVGAIPTNTNGNTQNLLRPLQLNGLNDNTLDAKINTLRANRLAFLPADQIIIEKTTNGGSTWTDAGISDANKVGLFSETRAGVSIPLLNGVKNINCGLRITITGMKYNVPSGTAETSKYNYWNSNYIVSTERYNQLKEMYFWVSSNSDTIGVKVERATGGASTTWHTIFDNSNYGMTGWSGNDYIRFSQGVFGGGTNQTGNYWNYRLTFFTRGPGGGTTLSGTNTTSAQVIQEIRGYGDTWWTAGNEYAANDKIYTHDYLKNVTFPAKVTASGGFSGNLTGNVTGNVSGTAGGVAWANVSGKPTATGSSATGITASTTATKTTLGTAFTIPNVTGVGSASTWAFEEISIPNVTSVGSASTWSFSDVTVPIRADSDTTVPVAASSATACDDITAWSAGSGSYSHSGFSGGSGTFNAKVTNHVLTFEHTHTAAVYGTDSHTHTAPSLSYTARSITGVSGSTTVRGVKTGTSSTTTASKASGGNGSAPTLGTAIKVQSKKSGANSTVPTLGTAFSVPNVTGNTSATVSITDPKHTHTIS